MVDPDVLRELFDRAVSLPPADRPAFLARVCGENSTLREQVERLLAAAHRHYEEVRLYIFSDHGMANCDEWLDLRVKVDTLNLRKSAWGA